MLSTFVLLDDMAALRILPNVLGRMLIHSLISRKRNPGTSQILHIIELLSTWLYAPTPSMHRTKHKKVGIGCCANGMSHTVHPCPSGQSELEWGTRGFHLIAELARQTFGNKVSERRFSCNAPDTPVLKCCHCCHHESSSGGRGLDTGKIFCSQCDTGVCHCHSNTLSPNRTCILLDLETNDMARFGGKWQKTSGPTSTHTPVRSRERAVGWGSHLLWPLASQLGQRVTILGSQRCPSQFLSGS